jgi:hypothetical protein
LAAKALRRYMLTSFKPWLCCGIAFIITPSQLRFEFFHFVKCGDICNFPLTSNSTKSILTPCLNSRSSSQSFGRQTARLVRSFINFLINGT